VKTGPGLFAHEPCGRKLQIPSTKLRRRLAMAGKPRENPNTKL
jgi:hypothetical protein